MTFDWTQIIGGVASGGLLGLFGQGVTSIIGFFQARQQQAHEIEMGKLELQRIAAQADAAAKLTEAQLNVTKETFAGQAFVASQQAETSITGESRWVSNIKALWRPVLTLLFLALTTAIFFATADAEMRAFITNAIVTATTAAGLWWFGTRMQQQLAVRKPTTAAAAAS